MKPAAFSLRVGLDWARLLLLCIFFLPLVGQDLGGLGLQLSAPLAVWKTQSDTLKLTASCRSDSLLFQLSPNNPPAASKGFHALLLWIDDRVWMGAAKAVGQNNFELYFTNQTVQGGFVEAFPESKGRPSPNTHANLSQQDQEINRMWAQMLNGMAKSLDASQSVGGMSGKQVMPGDIYGSRSVYIAVVLADGAWGVIEIEPQSAPFRDFTHACRGVLAAGIQSDKRFAGTPDQFVSKFPQFLAQAAAALGLDPHRYEKETEFLNNLVRTCAQITPEMGASVTDRLGNEFVGKLGHQYSRCAAGVASDPTTWDINTKRGIHYEIKPLNNWQDGFRLWVEFTGLKSDKIPAEPPGIGELRAEIFDTYGIVSASIGLPGTAASNHEYSPPDRDIHGPTPNLVGGDRSGPVERHSPKCDKCARK